MYRILLVEDDPGIAQAVCAHLRQWELDAQCVQNFRAVMEEFTAFDPQLVLLDISLPFSTATTGARRSAPFRAFRSCSSLPRRRI